MSAELRPTQAYMDWSARVREVSRLPKPELVRRARAQGVFGELERWSKDELVSTLCPFLPHDQMWEPAEPVEPERFDMSGATPGAER